MRAWLDVALRGWTAGSVPGQHRAMPSRSIKYQRRPYGRLFDRFDWFLSARGISAGHSASALDLRIPGPHPDPTCDPVSPAFIE